MHPVTITDTPLTLDDFLRGVAGAQVDLAAPARQRIRASRAVVERALERGDLAYGLNTGLGHGRDERVDLDTLDRWQLQMVRLHDGGIGRPLPTLVVRAAMLVRVNGIARGGSGAREEVATTLLAMLNAGVHPVVPEVGSVGASDLMHMASIGLVGVGEGEAEHRGERLPGREALRRAGIAPLVLGPKDGLALLSANGVSIGHGALVVARAQEVAEVADLAAALTLEAVRGNPSIVHPAVGEAKPIAGQIATIRHIRALLDGSALFDPGVARSVQDPLSFRVVPQVHGAFRELVSFARTAVETELNAMDDNPLAWPPEDRLISNGNFHPMLLALAFDALRPATAHVGQLSDRRMNHVWGTLLSNPSLMTSVDAMTAVNAGVTGTLQRYAAAALYAELRGLAGPATLDVGPLDLGVEDHATAAPLTVRRTDDALELVERILAVEALTARDVSRFASGSFRHGAGTFAALAALDIACGAGSAVHRPTAEIHEDVHRALCGPILEAAHQAAGWPGTVVGS